MLTPMFDLDPSVADFLARAEAHLLWLDSELSKTQHSESDRQAIRTAREELVTIVGNVTKAPSQ